MKTRKLTRLIRECEEEIQTLSALPYYTIFNRQAEQEADLKALQLKLEGYYAKLHKEKSQVQQKKTKKIHNIQYFTF